MFQDIPSYKMRDLVNDKEIVMLSYESIPYLVYIGYVKNVWQIAKSAQF